MGGRSRTFRNEFRLKNFGFSFLYLGESKHVFIQSQVSSWSECQKYWSEYKNELPRRPFFEFLKQGIDTFPFKKWVRLGWLLNTECDMTEAEN